MLCFNALEPEDVVLDTQIVHLKARAEDLEQTNPKFLRTAPQPVRIAPASSSGDFSRPLPSLRPQIVSKQTRAASLALRES